MKIIKRIIVLPFVFGILFVTHISFIFHRTYLFLRYGGEFANYHKDEVKTIQEIFHLIKQQHENKKNI